MIEVRETEAILRMALRIADPRVKADAARRIRSLALGNPGDVRPVGRGVSELRIHYGPGYRVYDVQRGNLLLVLLCSGDTDSQAKDIASAPALAKKVWNDHRNSAVRPGRLSGQPRSNARLPGCAFAGGDVREITDALVVVARAHGITQLAEEAGLARQALYKALSGDVNPGFATVLKVIRSLGLRLHPEPASAA